MLAERMALLRRGLGLSQAELAGKLHISPSAVGMYEQGRREPSLTALVRMAQVLEVSADYLLTGQPLCEQDRQAMDRALRLVSQGKADKQRFSPEEKQVLYAALMTEA